MYEENWLYFNRISGVNYMYTLPAKYIWPETMNAVTPSPNPPFSGGMGLNPTVTSLAWLSRYCSTLPAPNSLCLWDYIM